MGFGYGPLASSWYDTSSSTSFFHRNGSIINPYAEVYIRPELSSTDSSFRAIGDGGTAAETQKAVGFRICDPHDVGRDRNSTARSKREVSRSSLRTGRLHHVRRR